MTNPAINVSTLTRYRTMPYGEQEILMKFIAEIPTKTVAVITKEAVDLIKVLAKNK